MNRNQIDGMAKQLKGAIKVGTSKLTGNTMGQVSGKLEKGLGKVQKGLGDAQARARRRSGPL